MVSEAESLQILLIEDIPIYVGVLQRVLTSCGFSLDAVTTLAEGLEAAATRRYDVVLMDLGLPDSQGLATLITFGRENPDLPVVILTGTDDEALAANAVQQGAQDYLIKGPYLMQGDAGKGLLTRSLTYAVERHQIQAALLKERDLLEDRVAARTSALNKANLHLTALINAIPDLLCWVDSQGNLVDIRVPESFATLFPDPTACIGQPISEALEGVFTPQGLAYYHEAVTRGGVQAFEQVLVVDDKERFCEFRIIFSQDSDALISIRDVTEGKALERMWRRYEFIANASRDFLMLIDHDYRYQAVNDAYSQGNNLERDDIIGKTIADIWGKGLFEAQIKPHLDKAFKGETQTNAFEFGFGPLRKRYFENSYYPYFGQDDVVTHVVVVSSDRTAHHRNEETLRQYNQRLRYLASKLISAQEEERRRISLELHDEAGQALTALKLKLVLTQRQLPDLSGELEDTNRDLVDAIALVDTTMDQIRHLAHDLRPPALDAVGINQALDDYCYRFSENSRIDVSYIGVDIPELSGSIQITLYRMLQEALTNVIKHAQASSINVDLKVLNGNVILKVVDDGIGFDLHNVLNGTRRTGIGLVGIEERLEALGGRLEISSGPDKGTSLTAYVPWKDVQ